MDSYLKYMNIKNNQTNKLEDFKDILEKKNEQAENKMVNPYVSENKEEISNFDEIFVVVGSVFILIGAIYILT